MRRSALLINSTVMFIFTSILEMTLHELGHFLAAVSMGAHPVLYHNYVHYNDESLPLSQKIIFASAGPLISLVIGVVAQLMLSRNTIGMKRLFLVYFSVSGYLGFLGYLMVAPFFGYGDTGFVMRALDFPTWLIVTIAVAALAVLFFVLKILSAHFVSLMSEATAASNSGRAKFISSMILFPLFIGVPVLTLLNLPSPTFLSLLAPLCSPWSILWVYHYYLKGEVSSAGFEAEERIAQKVYPGWLVLMAVMILINRLLVYGLAA